MTNDQHSRKMSFGGGKEPLSVISIPCSPPPSPPPGRASLHLKPILRLGSYLARKSVSC